MSTYSIEEAKSGRAKCKKCKENIAKGALRIGAHAGGEEGGVKLCSWYHVECFAIPRKFKAEYSKEQFLQEMIEDNTVDSILSTSEEGLEDITAKMSSAIPAKKSAAKKSKSGGDDDDDDDGGGKKKGKRAREEDCALLASIKKYASKMALDASTEEDPDEIDEDTKQPAPKKTKIASLEQRQGECYNRIASQKLDALKDILRWNRVTVSGKKSVLILRIIDGETRGRLPNCPTCTYGKLRLNENGTCIECPGFFDKDTGLFEKCLMTMNLDQLDGDRRHWFTEKPTEEEEAAMDAEVEEGPSGASAGSSNDLPAAFLKLVRNIDWDVDSDKAKCKSVIKKTTMALVELLIADDSPVAMPEDALPKIKMAVGTMILQNKEKSLDDILALIVGKYGLKEAKKKASKAKAKATASLCNVAANGAIYNILTELATVYSKESNMNAAITYKKVAQAVKGLDFEITVDNAKGLGGGKKTKVAGIGKKSSEYMYEFLTTGQIQKLEEKKAAFE